MWSCIIYLLSIIETQCSYSYLVIVTAALFATIFRLATAYFLVRIWLVEIAFKYLLFKLNIFNV